MVPTMAQPFFLDDLNPPEPVAPYGFPAREAVCARLAEMSQELRERGVLAMSLFGSVARGEGGDESDIDVIIDTRDGFDLFDLASLTCLLEERMGTKVDIINRHSIESRRFAGRPLPKAMLQGILRDSILVF